MSIQNLSEIDNIMENCTNIGDCYLLIDQINAADNMDHNSSHEHYNIPLEESIMLPYALMPMLIVALILGHLIRKVGLNLELGLIWTRKHILCILLIFQCLVSLLLQPTNCSVREDKQIFHT